MYSREDKLKAVELFIKYDFSPQSVIDELGYPCRGTLYNWYREYLDNDGDLADDDRQRRYSEEMKRIAVGHYFEHGRCLARTCRMLGYPSKGLLAAWIDELEPGLRKVNRTHRGFTDDDKENAIVRLVAREGSAQAIADDLGVKRATLYNWKRKLLGEEAPSKMPRKKKDMTIEGLLEKKAALEADIDRLELKRAVLEGTAGLLGKRPGRRPEGAHQQGEDDPCGEPEAGA